MSLDTFFFCFSCYSVVQTRFFLGNLVISHGRWDCNWFPAQLNVNFVYVEEGKEGKGEGAHSGYAIPKNDSTIK